MLEPPVAVDHQPRIGRERGRRIEAAGEPARIGDADVPCDVAGERRFVQTQTPSAAGMARPAWSQTNRIGLSPGRSSISALKSSAGGGSSGASRGEGVGAAAKRVTGMVQRDYTGFEA